MASKKVLTLSASQHGAAQLVAQYSSKPIRYPNRYIIHIAIRRRHLKVPTRQEVRINDRCQCVPVGLPRHRSRRSRRHIPACHRIRRPQRGIECRIYGIVQASRQKDDDSKVSPTAPLNINRTDGVASIKLIPPTRTRWMPFGWAGPPIGIPSRFGTSAPIRSIALISTVEGGGFGAESRN